MEIINKNIRFLREQQGWTQKELAAKLDISKAMVGAYEEFRSIPLIPVAVKIAELFQLDLDTLVKTDLSKQDPAKANKEKFQRGKNVLAITVDRKGNEQVDLVTQKASAGYLTGYQDTEYIQDLPKISLPFLTQRGTYRAFEITGDSMLPLQPGSIVLAEYVDDLNKIKDGACYVILTRDEGISYKRVYNFLAASEKLLLVSDNISYAPYTVDAIDVIEVWKMKRLIVNEVSSKQNEKDKQAGLMAEAMMRVYKELMA
ncbi:MAG TPA: LexA family transcriptional regulator [Cyclobacteriaceae bacterium]|nr:LexA family transcriptional regulator [Cyclobacteriaceae bacterium]